MLRFTYHSRSSDCGWTAWEQVTIVISLPAEGYLGQRSQSFINISVVTQSAVRLVTVILVRWFGCLSLGLQSNGCDFFCTADCFPVQAANLLDQIYYERRSIIIERVGRVGSAGVPF